LFCGPCTDSMAPDGGSRAVPQEEDFDDCLRCVGAGRKTSWQGQLGHLARLALVSSGVALSAFGVCSFTKVGKFHPAVRDQCANRSHDLQVPCVLSRCSESLHPKLPLFLLPEDLQRAPEWYSYLHDIYGPSLGDPRHFPIDISTFVLLYGGKKALRKKLLPEAATCLDRGGKRREEGGRQCEFVGAHNRCPSRPGDLYGCATCGRLGCLWDLHDWIWIFQGAPRQAHPRGLPANSWVEVTHCTTPRESNDVGTWMYYAKGSGVFINTGATAVFESHADALTAFLGIENPRCRMCGKGYGRLVRNARAKGITTIQFTGHYDQRCGNTHLEVVHTKFSNSSAFELPIRCGLNGTCKCKCTLKTNDAGHGCPSCIPLCPD